MTKPKNCRECPKLQKNAIIVNGIKFSYCPEMPFEIEPNLSYQEPNFCCKETP